MITLEEIIEQINPLIIHYPEVGHNASTLKILAKEWYDLMKDDDVEYEEFEYAIQRSKKKCKFFPKYADIYEGIKLYRENTPRKEVPLIDENYSPPTDDVIQRNKKFIEIIAAQSAKKITYEEARELMKKVWNGWKKQQGILNHPADADYGV